MNSNQPNITFPNSELKLTPTTQEINQIDIKVPSTPQDFGVGARFTVNVMSDDYISIILDALASPTPKELKIQTDAVSTLIKGSERNILDYLYTVITKIAASGHHVSATILLSRGCPGEITCQLPNRSLATHSTNISLEKTGITVLAQWSLYPLFDDRQTAFSHMDDIYRAIDFAKDKGTYHRSTHFVTELKGDLAQVLETIAMGWMLVGQTVQHVTSHTTLSINSPTMAF
ncbi:YkoF family thiamine/hydroxymethylpyrimidine-binding protein [Thorsellia kenyensis]|uniref:YkoF family thiamine/hydroxymethylpyrimidine-binding protein n=1 Tax=Thorsellia kenyensis TaxID=1549888 RepID=A0ABV6C9W9_9GAMM